VIEDRPTGTVADRRARRDGRPTLAIARPPRRRWCRRFRPSGGLWLLLPLLIIGVVAVVLVTNLPAAAPATSPVVVVSMPYWNIDNATSSVLANRGDVNEVSPWVYGLDTRGDIVNQYPAGQRTSVAGDMARLRAAGLRIVPTLANVVGGDFAYQPIAAILHDPRRTEAHIDAIVNLVVRNDFTGVDIDYEDLHGGDRQAFTAFLTELATALHAHHKVLSAALFAKTTDAGYDQRNVAQDYAAIGKVVDQVRLMGYDYHWASSPPGPVAPVTWIRPVLAYARTQIAPAKIVLGVPMYGYDWVGDKGTTITWLQALRLAKQYGVRSRFDKSSQTPWFTYTDAAGRKHVVWFENAASVTAKLNAAQGAGIAGVYLWLYGYEDKGVWPALHTAFPLSAPQRTPASVERPR
jgi:spore germination protein YaaH